MFRRLGIMLAISSTILFTSASSASSTTWRPTLIPLTTSTRLIAVDNYHFLCSGTWKPDTREETRWQSSFCGRSKTNAAASRLGWCHRWAIQKPKKISVTCSRDIHKTSV